MVEQSLVSESSFSQPTRSFVVAHRGASAAEAENTLVAFERAIQAGADSVEFDVRLTADDRAVVLHDPDLRRTTDAAGLVHELTLAEVKKARIRTGGGDVVEVPTLDEALAYCSGRVAVNVELKNIPGEPDFDPDRQRVTEATLRALDEEGFVGPVLLSSFNPWAIARARELAPDVPTGLLTDHEVEADAALTYAERSGHPWVLPSLRQVGKDPAGIAARAHEAGVLVGTWISDDPAQVVELFRSGIDAVATNDPEAVVQVVRQAFAP